MASIPSTPVCHHGAMAGDRVEQALSLAREASARAYAPYSGFQMGAAVGTVSGALVPGTLVENVSLGLAMCAERIALFSAVARGPRRSDRERARG
jgi:cytidine deaminase